MLASYEGSPDLRIQGKEVKSGVEDESSRRTRSRSSVNSIKLEANQCKSVRSLIHCTMPEGREDISHFPEQTMIERA